MNEKKRGPLAHIVKRPAISRRQAYAIRAMSILLAVVVCAIVTFLLTGDAEAEEEAQMLKAEKVGKVNVYKAGHHGSAYSSTSDLLAVIRPDIAVISCGMENPYGHPADSTIKRLKEYTDHIYRTDVCGTIVIESDGNKLSLTPERRAE